MTTHVSTLPRIQEQVVIVGAGIGGLALGFQLKQRGIPFIILEQGTRVGGSIQSAISNGFLCEWGPNSTYARREVIRLVQQLGLSNEVVYLNPRDKKKYLVVNQQAKPPGVLVAAPRGIVDLVRSPILSASGKLRLLLEPFVRRGVAEDESVASFIERRFGRELAQNVVAPFLSGIWAADIRSLSAREAFKLLWTMEQEFGSVARGLFHRVGSPREPRPLMLSFAGGMERLTARLSEELSTHIYVGHTVTAIKSSPGGVVIAIADKSNGHGQDILTNGSHLVLTGDTLSTSALVELINPIIAAQIRAVPYAPLGIMHVAFSTTSIKHSLDGFGFLVPPQHTQALLGAIFSSSLYPGRAPDGTALLTVFSGGAVNPAASDVTRSAVRDLVLNDLSTLLGASSPCRVLNEIYLPRAIPNYPVGHFQLREGLANFQRQHPLVHILGNWLEGLSVADRIEKAAFLATELAQSLGPGNQERRAVNEPST